MQATFFLFSMSNRPLNRQTLSYMGLVQPFAKRERLTRWQIWGWTPNSHHTSWSSGVKDLIQVHPSKHLLMFVSTLHFLAMDNVCFHTMLPSPQNSQH